MKRLVLAITVCNTAGVLSRITGLFSRRGFNIDSLTVGETINPEFSRITVTCSGNDAIFTQIKNQVRKLIDVVEIIELSSMNSVYRELVMIKVKCADSSRASIIEIANVFRARIIDIAVNSLIVEITGDFQKTDALINMLQPYGIIELIRTGLTGVLRGDSDYIMD